MKANRKSARMSSLCLVALLILCKGAVGADQFAGGTGEPNDPYLIATAEQLLEADFSEPGVHYQLCANIDLDRKPIMPNYFRAHLDGAGFEIQNAVVSLEASLFGIIEAEGVIANLTLADLDLGLVPLWGGGPIGRYGVGSMASENHGTIANCGVTGWIVTDTAIRVGGLVGYNGGTITNCFFNGWISGGWEQAEVESDGFLPCIGGLVAQNAGSIANSFADAVIVGPTGLGGLVGYNTGTIRNAYAMSWVLGEAGCGGLVSVNSGTLYRCYAIGRVTGELRGGLLGLGGIYEGKAIECLWDTETTDCPTSGAGTGYAYFDWGAPDVLALCGWTGDPNWVVVNEYGLVGSYPRLTWEGTDGETVPQPPPFWGPAGDGTESDPYVIATRDALLRLCRAPVYWDKHFVLAEDLDLRFNQDFSPIGVCQGASFSGTFDGNGHVIRNVVFDPSYSDKPTVWNLGLFGYMTGEVRNLRLEDVRFYGGANSQRVGLLAGTSEGLVDNCSATGSIAVGANSRFLGELIGLNGGDVRECDATATIEAGEGSTYIGGLVGL